MPVFLDSSEPNRISEKLERFRTQVYQRKYLPLAHAFPCVRSAGSVEAAYALFTGHASIGDYLGAFLVPTLLRNSIGGVSLAFLNHAPLTSELEIAAGAAE